MAALQLTRLQIITQGLSLAGRPDLLSDARMWLSMFLEDIYLNQDLDWLVKKETGIAVANGTAVPIDYRAAKSATLVNSLGREIAQVSFLTKPEEIDHKLMNNYASVGKPRYCYVDQVTGAFQFIPAADNTYTMNLFYYYIPEIGDVEDSSCDQDIPLWNMPTSILIDHVKARAMEYNDDQRQESANTTVRNKFMEAKMNNHDRRAGPSRIQMGKRFKRRF